VQKAFRVLAFLDFSVLREAESKRLGRSEVRHFVSSGKLEKSKMPPRAYSIIEKSYSPIRKVKENQEPRRGVNYLKQMGHENRSTRSFGPHVMLKKGFNLNRLLM
jgi:hypothetical protein